MGGIQKGSCIVFGPGRRTRKRVAIQAEGGVSDLYHKTSKVERPLISPGVAVFRLFLKIKGGDGVRLVITERLTRQDLEVSPGPTGGAHYTERGGSLGL